MLCGLPGFFPGRPLFDRLRWTFVHRVYGWTNVHFAGGQQFLTLQPGPLPLLPFPLGRGLPNQQLNVCHVESAIRQNFHKAKFHEYLDCPLYRSNLVPGESGNGLDSMGKMLVEHENPTAFQ